MVKPPLGANAIRAALATAPYLGAAAASASRAVSSSLPARVHPGHHVVSLNLITTFPEANYDRPPTRKAYIGPVRLGLIPPASDRAILGEIARQLNLVWCGLHPRTQA